METRTIIVGYGEIGQALEKVFKDYEPMVHDPNKGKVVFGFDYFDVMHICFPYSESFVQQVKYYQDTFHPKFTVIHSTVPVGTSRKCDAIHSPVVGIHPYLTESILTFTKFLGGEQASEVADYFRRANVKVYITDNSESTELMKILCTTKYGVDIEYVKDVKRQCEKLGVPFELWTLWNYNYNNGYQKLGQEQYTRPNLTPIMKKIDGHCVLPNTELLETEFTKLIKKLNSSK